MKTFIAKLLLYPFMGIVIVTFCSAPFAFALMISAMMGWNYGYGILIILGIIALLTALTWAKSHLDDVQTDEKVDDTKNAGNSHS